MAVKNVDHAMNPLKRAHQCSHSDSGFLNSLLFSPTFSEICCTAEKDDPYIVYVPCASDYEIVQRARSKINLMEIFKHLDCSHRAMSFPAHYPTEISSI